MAGQSKPPAFYLRPSAAGSSSKPPGPARRLTLPFPLPLQPSRQSSALAQAVRIAIIVALVSVGFNTLVLYAREPRGVLPTVAALLPAAVLTALIWLKPVTSLMVASFAQRYYTDRLVRRANDGRPFSLSLAWQQGRLAA